MLIANLASYFAANLLVPILVLESCPLVALLDVTLNDYIYILGCIIISIS